MKSRKSTEGADNGGAEPLFCRESFIIAAGEKGMDRAEAEKLATETEKRLRKLADRFGDAAVRDRLRVGLSLEQTISVLEAQLEEEERNKPKGS